MLSQAAKPPMNKACTSAASCVCVQSKLCPEHHDACQADIHSDWWDLAFKIITIEGRHDMWWVLVLAMVAVARQIYFQVSGAGHETSLAGPFQSRSVIIGSCRGSMLMVV